MVVEDLHDDDYVRDQGGDSDEGDERKSDESVAKSLKEKSGKNFNLCGVK